MNKEELKDLLESLPCPFCTKNIDDSVFDNILMDFEVTMKPWYDWEKEGSVVHDQVSMKEWEVLENLAYDAGIPYYEDLKK